MITFRPPRLVNFRGTSHRMYTNISKVLTTLPALYPRLLLYGLSSPLRTYISCVHFIFFPNIYQTWKSASNFFLCLRTLRTWPRRPSLSRTQAYVYLANPLLVRDFKKGFSFVRVNLVSKFQVARWQMRICPCIEDFKQRGT